MAIPDGTPDPVSRRSRPQSGYPAHGALLSCIISLASCIKRRGCPFPSKRTPAWTVQKPEYSASRSLPATPRIGEATQSTSFWGPARRETHVIAAPDPVRQPKLRVEGPRWPKKTLPARMQPPRPAEYSQKCTARPGGPVRAVKKHARIQENASVKVRWQQGRQAASGIPSVSARAPRPPCVSGELHVLRRCQNPAYANLQLSR